MNQLPRNTEKFNTLGLNLQKPTKLKSRCKVAVLFLVIFVMIITQTACDKKGDTPSTAVGEGFYLDTFCRITVYSMKESTAMTSGEVDVAISEAFRLCTEYENLLSKTKGTSDIYALNESEGEPVECDERTIGLIKDGLQYGYFSEGSFNIIMGTLVDAWDFHAEEPKVPSDAEIREALLHVPSITYHSSFMPLLIEGSRVSLEDPEMRLDLGGIAKGYIADRMAEHLIKRGVTGAVIDLGGNIVVIGYKDGSKATSEIVVGIKLPYTEINEIVGSLAVHDACVVTSGTYERYIEEDGVKYHHILDPVTGYPAEAGLQSVTVVGALGTAKDCDALATTILLKGEDWLMEQLDDTAAEATLGIDLNEFSFILIRDDGSIATAGSDNYVFKES